MSKSRYKVADASEPHFFTCTVVGWLPVFTRPDAVQIILDSWRFLHDNARLTLYGYVVMENHLHLIASAEDLARQVADFKAFTARQIIDLLQKRGERLLLSQLRFFKDRRRTDREYQLWHEESHPQMIQGEDMMRQKLEYMHNNPVRRGYVADPTHWRYSSAADYAGPQGLIPFVTDW